LVFLHSVLKLLVTVNVVLSSLILFIRMRQCILPKRRFLQEPHGVTSQNTAFLIFLIYYDTR
jgi:hypothetical protein